MPTFEDLRLKDLILKFRASIAALQADRNLSELKEAGKKLQDVYDFFLLAENGYEDLQDGLKNMFSSFNYAAVIVNNAIKSGKLTNDDSQLLNECIEIMLRCCDAATEKLSK